MLFGLLSLVGLLLVSGADVNADAEGVGAENAVELDSFADALHHCPFDYCPYECDQYSDPDSRRWVCECYPEKPCLVYHCDVEPGYYEDHLGSLCGYAYGIDTPEDCCNECKLDSCCVAWDLKDHICRFFNTNEYRSYYSDPDHMDYNRSATLTQCHLDYDNFTDYRCLGACHGNYYSLDDCYYDASVYDCVCPAEPIPTPYPTPVPLTDRPSPAPTPPPTQPPAGLVDCPNLCTEEGHLQVCRPDVDGNYMLVCDMMIFLSNDTATDIFPGEQGFDCWCNLTTPAPTAPPTAPPTPVPTPGLTAPPTAPPTPEPTAPPTAPPTPVPTPAPTNEPTAPPTAPPTGAPTCAPGILTDYNHDTVCHEDSHGTVELGVIKPHVHAAHGHETWPPGSKHDGIDYDCWCDPDCSTAKIHAFGIIEPWFSAFDNDTFHYCLAVPESAHSHVIYFVDADGNPVEWFGCDDTNNLGQPGCEDWFPYSYKGATWGGLCYDTICVDALWRNLSLHLTPHQDDVEWEITYFGVIHTESWFDREQCWPDGSCVPYNYSWGTNHLWSVSVPIHIALHITEFKLYDKLKLVVYEISESVVVTNFAWGFDQKEVHARIRVRTLVQWPAKLTVKGLDFNQPGLSATATRVLDCVDIGAAEEYDAAYNASLDANGLPPFCFQDWEIEIWVTDDSVCKINDTFQINWDVECQPSFDHNCPFSEAYADEELYGRIDFHSDDFCFEFNQTLEVTGELSAYGCDHSCDCPTWNFVMDHDTLDGELEEEFGWFQAVIQAPEVTITGTFLKELIISTDCTEDGSEVEYFLVRDGSVTGRGNAVGLIVDNFPDPMDLCVDGVVLTEEAVLFHLHFSPLLFVVPAKSSCEFSIWATIEVFYLGFGPDPPTRLLEVSSTKTIGGDDVVRHERFRGDHNAEPTSPKPHADLLEESSTVPEIPLVNQKILSEYQVNGKATLTRPTAATPGHGMPENHDSAGPQLSTYSSVACVAVFLAARWLLF